MANPLHPNHCHGMLLRTVLCRGVVCLTFILTGLNALQAQAEEAHITPRQVVHQWLRFYPHDLTHAVTLTSPDFREHMPPSEWISHKAPLLKQIRLQYLDSQILKEEIDGTNAVIKVKVLIDTMVGEQIQVERYDLHRYCSVWLLEQVRVLDEWFLGNTLKQSEISCPVPLALLDDFRNFRMPHLNSAPFPVTWAGYLATGPTDDSEIWDSPTL